MRIDNLVGGGCVVINNIKDPRPHFGIAGARSEDLDHAKVLTFLIEGDWSDRQSPTWTMPWFTPEEFKDYTAKQERLGAWER